MNDATYMKSCITFYTINRLNFELVHFTKCVYKFLSTHSANCSLRSIAKPLVWAVRSGMLKNNISQANLYANEMAKEKKLSKSSGYK